MKASGSKIKHVERFTYLGSIVEENGEILNEINKGIRKTSQIYHLLNSIIWNKDIESVKPRYTRCTLRRYYYME
jgi:hypothetical protein